jgi:hypothetical protein
LSVPPVRSHSAFASSASERAPASDDARLVQVERLDEEFGRGRGERPDSHAQCEVEAPLAQPRHDLRRRNVGGADRRFVPAAPQPRQRVRQQPERRGGRGADRETARARAAQLGDLLARALQVGGDRAGAREKGAADLGQLRAAHAARDQHAAQLFLQLAHALGQSRLADAEAARGGAHASGVDHGQEIADLRQPHR